MSEEHREAPKELQVSEEYKHEAYGAERRFWHERMHAESLALDKSLITLSTAAIGFLWAITTQIVKAPDLIHAAFLVASSSCFVVAIFKVHASHVWSQNIANCNIDELDVGFTGGDSRSARTRRKELSDRLTKINVRARQFFRAGIIIGLLFVVYGLYTQDNNNMTENNPPRPAKESPTIGKGPSLPPSAGKPAGINPDSTSPSDTAPVPDATPTRINRDSNSHDSSRGH